MKFATKNIWEISHNDQLDNVLAQKNNKITVTLEIKRSQKDVKKQITVFKLLTQ